MLSIVVLCMFSEVYIAVCGVRPVRVVWTLVRIVPYVYYCPAACYGQGAIFSVFLLLLRLFCRGIVVGFFSGGFLYFVIGVCG